MIPENDRDVRDNENRVMYNDRESVTLLKGDVERPCLRACERDGRERSQYKRDSNI